MQISSMNAAIKASFIQGLRSTWLDGNVIAFIMESPFLKLPDKVPRWASHGGAKWVKVTYF